MRGFPNRYVVLDTESTETVIRADPRLVRLTLRLGVALYVECRAHDPPQEYTYEFTTPDEFHKIIESLPCSDEPIYVFAHNMGFDCRQVEWMGGLRLGRYTHTPSPAVKDAGRYKVPLFIADDTPFIIRLFRPDGQRIMLLDTMQWYGVGLERLGEWIGYAKWRMPHFDEADDVWMAYCRRDVEVLHAALRRLWGFLRSRQLPDWHVTPAAQSMQVYRMRYEQRRIVRRVEPDVLKLDRHAYYGALVEAFRVGPCPGLTHKIDVNSLYPYMMLRHEYPCEVLEQGEGGEPDDLFGSDGRINCTAEVWLESPMHPWPVKGVDRTLWVTGRVRTILCGPELARACGLGIVARVGRWVRYRLDALFTEFVTDFWAARVAAEKEGDKLTSKLCKALMNSLYGKFGQRVGEWRATGVMHPEGEYTHGKYWVDGDKTATDLRVLNGVEFIRDPESEDPRGFVPIAAWTASYARCHMWDMVHTAGIENVHHISTDSLMVNGVGLGALQLAGVVEEGALGCFRVEGSDDRAEVNGPGLVTFDGKKKRPGVKRKAREVGPEVWEYDKWSGFAEDVFRGRLGSVTIESIQVRLSLASNRRERLSNGTTQPWSIDNWNLTPEDQSDSPITLGRFGEVT